MVVRCLLVGVLMTAALAAQQGPAFDAVSIKRNTSIDRTRPPSRGTPSRFVMSDATGLQLLVYAFGRRQAEIIGAPEWTSSEHYDVMASAGHPVAPNEMKAMLRQILADRFQLVAHTERREMQLFALVRARGDGRLGPRIKPWTVDCAAVRHDRDVWTVRRAGGIPLAVLAESLACLKLESERAQVDVLVIDRIGRPSEN